MKKYIVITVLLILALLLGATLIKPKTTHTIYEFDGKKVDAETYYDMMVENYGYDLVFQYLEKAYLETLEVSDDIASMSKLQAKEMITEETTDEDKEAIGQSLKALGYSGINELETFFIHSNLRRTLIADNYRQYIDVDALLNDLKPRLVTHILVLATQEDKEHAASKVPTKKEKLSMDKVDAALKDSDNIRLDMIKVSDSKTIVGENLGYVDKNSQLVEAFLTQALKTEQGTLSGWVKTSYGYHRIYVESTDVKDFEETEEYLAAVQNYDTKVATKVMLGVMKESGVTINSELEAKLLESLEG